MEGSLKGESASAVAFTFASDCRRSGRALLDRSSTNASMELMVIEVKDIPDILTHEQTRDQLKIHFLRRSNKGGDVLEVIYPTRTESQAYVIFEAKEVPGVLGHSHYLEVESNFYPVRVQRASQSEVDMQVETKLDSSMFANLQKVEQLIKENGFEITKLPAPDLYRLKGTLLNLKLLRKQLTPYLHQDLLHQSCYPSGLSNGYSSASLSPVYRTELGRSAAKSSSENSLHFVNGVHPWRGSPMVDGATSFVDASPASFKRQPISTAYGDAGSPRSYPNLHDDPYQSRPPTRQRQESTVFERDILDYALHYNQEVFNDIHTNYGTKMSLKDDEDITTVTFLGRNCRRATAMLQALIEDIRPRLRTQEINLKKYSSREQGQIHDRINLYKDLGVLIKHDSNIIKLVGSSKRSFQVKQMLLGIEGDWSTSTQRGRKLERSSLLRRSSSLPKQHKFSTVRETDQRHSPVPDYKGGAAKVYSPSNYQEDPQTGKSPQTGSPDKQTRRRRSMSLDSSKSRETREQPKQSKQLMASGGELMLPSSVEKKKSPIAQAFTMVKLRNMIPQSKTEFKRAFQRNKY